MPSVLENRLDLRAQAQYGTPSWGDYGSTIFNVGGAEALSAVPAIARWGAQSLPGDSEIENTIADSAKYLQDALHSYSEGSFDQLSPSMKERLTTDILTSEEFWQHPISVMTAQTARTLPTMAATGLSMLFSGGGFSALMAAGATGGTLGMGQSIDAMQRDVDTRSDAELKEFNPTYRQLRTDGVSEGTARKQLQQAMIGAKPLAIFALSAATNAFGPETQALRALGMKGLGQAAGGGISRRVGKEAVQGAAAEGIEESGQQAFQEQAAVDAGFQPAVNWGNVAQSGLSAAAIGAVIGAPAGIRRGNTPASRPGDPGFIGPPEPYGPRRPPQPGDPNFVGPLEPYGPPVHDTTTAGGRAHPSNPSSVDYGERFGPPRLPSVTADYGEQYGPPSMPKRGNDTEGSVPIVPGKPPPVPGGTTRRRSSKKGTVSAVSTENAPTVTGTARIVMDDAQAVAVEATKSPAQTTAQNLPSIVSPPSPTPLPNVGTMPAPGPTANVAPATPTPTEDMGAGTTQAKVGDLVNIEIGGAIANPTPVRVRSVTPDGFVLVEGSNTGVPIQQVSVVTPAPRPAVSTEPVTYDEQYGPPRLPPVTAEYEQTQDYPRQPRTADGRRVLDTVPDQATLDLTRTREEQLASRNARLPESTIVDTTPAPVAGKAALKGKDLKRNAKRVGDGVKAETLLGQRPRDLTVPSVPELRSALQDTVDKADKAGIEIPSKVGYDTTPDTLVWLAEAKALLKKLDNPKLDVKAKDDAINTFLDGEQQLIHDGHAEVLRGKRAQEGTARKQGVFSVIDETMVDPSGPAAPAVARGSRGGDRPGLDIRDYTEEHNIPQKGGEKERLTRQQVAQGEEDVSKLSPYERIKLIAERGKPQTEPKAGPKTKKALSAAQKNKQQRVADKKAEELEKAKAVAKGLPKEQAEAAKKAAAEQEAARIKEVKAKEAADTETAIKQLMKEKKLTKRAATAIVKGHAKERQQKAAAAAKAEQEREEAKRTFVGPVYPKTLAALQTAERVKARKESEKQARSEAAAEKRTPFSTLKALTKKAQEAKARAFKPVVRTKLEIAQSLAARRAKRPTLTMPSKLRSLQALSSPHVMEKLFGKKKLQAEKKKIEETPSAAKQEADNFTKGHVSIAGVPVSIETKAGFGSIPGTVDTNGKPVKVLLGEEAVPGNKNIKDLQVAVIDQVDPDTGALTNHVVLYGFDDVQAAVNEFDGNFPDQMGDFAVMSHDELKAWVKSKENAEPVGVLKVSGVSEEDVADLAQELGIPLTPRERQEANAEYFRQIAERNSVQIKTVDQAFEEIRLIQISNSNIFPTAQRLVYKLFAKRIRRLARDVKIYVVPDVIYEADLPGPQYAAYYVPYGKNGHIVLRESHFRNPAAYSQYVLHEATHAAFVKAVHSNPELAAQLRKILQAAEAAYQVWWRRQPMYSTSGELKSDPRRPYGFTNPDEMLAELTSRPSFMMWMSQEKAGPDLLADLGIKSNRVMTWWDWAVNKIGELLDLPNAAHSYLGATLKVMERLEYQAENVNALPLSEETARSYMKQFLSPSSNLLDIVTEHIPERFRPAPGQEQMSNPRLLSLRSMDGIAQLSKQFGRPFYKHVRAIADNLERIRVSANKYLQAWLPTIEASRKLEHKYKGTEHWSNYNNLLHDERAAGVFAHLPLEDQPHIGKDSLNSAYPKARWADLNARWQALPDDLKAARMRTLNFYAARQNEVNEKKLRNVMRAAGFSDPALIQRIFNRTETEADKALLGSVYDHIRDVEQLSKVSGPYYSFERYGTHVVRAHYKITPPRKFLRELPEEDGTVNTWEFGGPSMSTEDARKMAMDYAGKQTNLYPTVTSVWVNEATGERTYTDASGEEQRVSAKDPDSVQRFRVSVENRYVEFFEEAEARRVALELESHPDVVPGSVKGVEKRRFQPQDRQMDLASYKMQALASTIKKRKSFKNLSATEQAEVEGVLMEAGLRMMPHTRIQTRHLPYNHIQGASRDSTRAMLQHAESMSGFMSRLDHQQDLNEAVTGMIRETGTDAGKSLSRSHIANHVLERVHNSAAAPATGFWNGLTSRWLITSYLARLVSPATVTINMLQPITTTLPLLSARFGPGRAAREMLRVYKLVGTGHTIKTGLIATGRAIRHGASAEHPSMVEDMMVGLNAGQRRMVKELIDLGSIDPDAGIEVSLLHDVEDSVVGRVDRVLDFLQRFSRQMPRATEAINRVVTAVAAYNLEMEKTGNHDIAVRFAQETTNMTQGIYSRTNAAPIFNHPIGRLSLQFKQYAQLIYGLIGHQIDKAYRNAEPGDRAEALKSLGFMAIAYTTVAGTMGLPTEPIKLLLMAAAPLGLPFKWEDFEHGERELMASIFGQQIGEIITHGISRALPEGLGFDLSSRVGLQDLLLFGEPRSEDEQDVKAYAWDVVAGAPGALIADWFRGTQDLLGGNILEASQKLNPLKVGADLVKSYRAATEGKRTGAGYQSLSPYSLGEAAIRTFGFTPARESEAGEASRYFYAKQAENQAARGSYLHQWAAASGSERARLWGQIERYNRSREDDERLTRADLDRYVRSRATIEKSRRSGLRLTRREQSLYKDITGVYNIQ